jgi:transcriptional regulator with XRE-family HTH domain
MPEFRFSPDALRRERTRAGLTYEKLAQLAGSRLVTTWRVETGRSAPTIATLCKLAAALEIHPTELFEPVPAGERAP